MLDREAIEEFVRPCLEQVEAAALDEMAVPSYLHQNLLVRWMIRERLHRLVQIVRRTGSRQVLDFGCGLGLLGEALRDDIDHVYLCDVELRPATAMVSQHGLTNATLLPPDEIEIRIEDGALDTVVAADVLEHFDTTELVIAQCGMFARKLSSNGLLLLSGPTETRAYRTARWVAGFAGDYHHRDVFDLETLLEGTGWTRQAVDELPRWSPVRLFRVSEWRPPDGVRAKA